MSNSLHIQGHPPHERTIRAWRVDHSAATFSWHIRASNSFLSLKDTEDIGPDPCARLPRASVLRAEEMLVPIEQLL